MCLIVCLMDDVFSIVFISQDGQYRSRADGWYGRYEGHPAAYRDQNYQYREPQPERPSSRTSQYSDRPSSRLESFEDVQFHTILCVLPGI